MICLFNFVYLRIHVPMFLFMFVLLKTADGFTVKGPSGPLVVPLGGSVLLPCSVDSLLSLEDLKVKWRRSDSQTLIHLYQDGDVRPEAQHQDYHDRAHFITEDIKHGNFSLLLENVRAEDEGQYTCKVFIGKDDGETVVEIKDVERLIVSGSDHSVSAYVGEDVTLNCSVDSHIPPDEIEEVSWKKTDKDGNILVLFYENSQAHPDSSNEQYRDRVEFFTDEIHRGNFSLRLKNVRTEDKGLYMCQVFAGGLSANTTVKLEQLGFSALHIIVLILCVAACGSAVLFCCLVYCRPNTGFRVEGLSRVHRGDSIVLPCFIDPQLMTDDLKVKWRRSGLNSPVCVYEDGAETQHQDYHDRAHFITEDIKHGNFSLLLENVRAEDSGEYRFKVNCEQRSVFSFTVNLKHLGGFFFSVEYSCDLVVPVGASVVLPCVCTKPLPAIKKVEWSKSDSTSPMFIYEDGSETQHDRAHLITEDIKHGNFSLLLKNVTDEDEGQYRCKVYRRQRPVVFSDWTKLKQRILDSALRLQLLLVFCPNIIMFLAFILWGVSEGSVNETVCCCALYILRPLMLLWAAPYMYGFRARIKTLILKYSCVAEYFVLTPVVYSVLLTNTWQKLQNFAEFVRVLIIILYVIMFLCCSCKAIYILAAQIGKRSGLIIKILDIVADLTFEILPILQFILLFYTFGSAGAGFIIIVAVLPVLLSMTNERMFYKCYDHFSWSDSVITAVWLIVTLVLNAVMIGLYVFTLENKTDPVGWACVMVFLQILWTLVRFTDLSEFSYLDIDLGFHRFVSVYVFGSVGVVLISAAALMTELMLKTVNGERSVMDLRFIVFPSECFFILSVIISGQFASKIKKCLKSCQKQTSDNRPQQDENQHSPLFLEACDVGWKLSGAAGSDEPPVTGSNQNTRESHEMNPLMETEDHQTVQIQPDSLISQP